MESWKAENIPVPLRTCRRISDVELLSKEEGTVGVADDSGGGGGGREVCCSGRWRTGEV